jgi:uncharacterized protein YegL
MKENLTEIVALLDKSGSMERLRNDTIGGFNHFLKEQKDVPGEAFLTTVLFNDKYKLLHDRVNIRDVKPVGKRDYSTAGNTALLDALGKTIDDIGVKLRDTDESERPDKVIFFIITDGEENSSRKYSKEKVKAMVELQRNTYSWEFLFLGANVDSFAEASSIGVSTDNAFDYADDSEGVFSVHDAMSKAVSNLRQFKSLCAEEGVDFKARIKPKNK